tara:strand:+ start:854 stop:1081 length:228 start_codon:yes stop_codon:yes gene_type:complete
MYLNDQPEPSQETLSSLDANEGAMDIVYRLVIEPMEEKLNEEEGFALALAGSTLKLIAEKAYAYEKMQNGEDLQN